MLFIISFYDIPNKTLVVNSINKEMLNAKIDYTKAISKKIGVFIASNFTDSHNSILISFKW